ncbi:hypothetical protein [Salegentibacter mishustinae]|uniref:Uncharacterized protein n=1 Tax=Salegentibacter mishustinae TaxID=270918 RepID=A0A0Q9ZFN1_9FLAO|nr:hypothetical protein [Salegentibacter mishustinae]KRG28930.1 hypothetical protein APR42_03090 [Salegentibacter mishustinae]PNW22020.1 hypothetical protein APB85_12405 [Salegentibacter mishustinae]PZX65379.1 hypothetical protein LY54_01673 [Salegentibacter mishustinae]
MRFRFRVFSLLSVLLFCFGSLAAQETTVMVRALAKDAKFIGSSIGGAKIIVRNAETGAILDQGFTSGSTGDTKLILKTPQERYGSLTDEETAGFKAELDITEPIFIEIEAHAPFNKKQTRVVSSTQLWVIPGKNITGDGVVLEVPGFVVDILSPQTHERIKSSEVVSLKANIVMMCGCPVTEGGTWDANQYEVKAILAAEGKESREIALKPTDKASTFEAETSLDKGYYTITVYAFDPVTGNTGVDKTNIIIN